MAKSKSISWIILLIFSTNIFASKSSEKFNSLKDTSNKQKMITKNTKALDTYINIASVKTAAYTSKSCDLLKQYTKR